MKLTEGRRALIGTHKAPQAANVFIRPLRGQRVRHICQLSRATNGNNGQRRAAGAAILDQLTTVTDTDCTLYPHQR